MNDVNKNLRAFHLSIDELLKALAYSEDVNRTVAHTSLHAESGDITHLPFPATRSNLYDRFMSSAVNPIFYRLFVKAAAFQVRDACIGCGQCADRCPMNNITIKAGKPVWGNDCTHCMACICYCPTEAIEYGKKSVGKPRYHFEQLGSR